MPAMILADGMLGQMMEPVQIRTASESLPDKPWATTGTQNARTHNIINSLYINPEVLEDLVAARYKKYDEIKKNHQMSESYLTGDADIIVVAYGASARVVRSAVNQAREEGIKAGMVRPISLWPFPADAVNKAAETAKVILSVEMSMGQMVDDVRLIVNGRKPTPFFGRTGGVIPTPAEILSEIRKYNSEFGILN
jgi:2-oxoglutarate ferredoxin oxidoreductase subunit alpha